MTNTGYFTHSELVYIALSGLRYGFSLHEGLHPSHSYIAPLGLREPEFFSGGLHPSHSYTATLGFGSVLALKGHYHLTKGISPSQGQSPQCSPERA